MLARSAGFATLALALSACTAVPSAPRFNHPHEASAMTADPVSPPVAMARAPLNAEQALTRLLGLLRQVKATNDMTKEHVNQAFGVTMSASRPDEYGFGEAITPEWSYGVQFRPKAASGARFEFSFNPDQKLNPPLTAVCRMDFDRFSAELQGMGFERSVRYGEHQRIDHYLFERPAMTVKVYIEGEANDPVEKIGHACVRMVLVP